MSLYIPKLEWNDQTVTATASAGSPTLSGISSTVAINAGMIASGTGIPTGAAVISKTASSVTLSANATSSGSYAINFVERIEFDFPPTSDTEEQLRPKQTVSESLSGKQQVVTDYLEAIRTIKLNFINKTLADKLQDNFYRFAYKGNLFKYYPDKDEVEVFVYELDDRNFTRVRVVKKHPYFLYEIGFKFRRVVE